MQNHTVIMYPLEASEQEKFVAKEIRRYLYLRTAVLLPLVSGDRLPERASGFAVGYPDSSLIKSTNINRVARQSENTDQSYHLETLIINNRKWIVATGGRNGALLYAAYRLAENYGIRFSLHGDIIPDHRVPLEVIDVTESASPLFELRGILPFHDFPEGPDWWNEDDYKSVLSQLPKLGMNFIGLHTYPERPRTNLYASAEPVTWIGLPEDVNPDGEVLYSYPSRHFSTINGAWGYAAQKTSTYTDGGAMLFERDVYGADYMQGMAPWPEAQEESNELFNRFGRLLRSVFTHARELGISTCLGTEGPLTIPQEVKARLQALGLDPSDAKTVMRLYEGIFTRIKRMHPLDYFWLWTPETWTWGGNSEEQTQETLQHIQMAIEGAQKAYASVQIATSGWVLGPQTDRTMYDRQLPKTVPFSCINRNLGIDFIEPGFQSIVDRPLWAIPWVEDDPAMNLPQLWAGRMRRDAADALAYGCNGLMGIHWRTKVIDPTISALAAAAWKQIPWNSEFGQKADQVSYTMEGSTSGRIAVAQALEGWDAIYNTARIGMKGYRVQVPNGTYKVTFRFREWEVQEVGKRVFDIYTNGGVDKRLYQLDIFANVGRDKIWSCSIDEFKVADGLLDLTFRALNGEALLSALEIEGMTENVNQFKGFAYSRKINCGGSAIGEFEADLPELFVRERDLPIEDFYMDWATAQFGLEIAADAAQVFTAIDGKLPRPITWVSGPGSTIEVNRVPWEDIADNYWFVNHFESLRGRVQGAGQLERFDYWLNQFRYLRSAAMIGCTFGMYEEKMKQVMLEQSESLKRAMAREQLLPMRKQLVSQYAELNRYLLETVSTPGELGTFANIQQQTMHSQLHLPGKELEDLLGEPLPTDAMPSSQYTGKPRLIVPTVRTSLNEGETFSLKILLLGFVPTELIFYWKPLGGEKYRKAGFVHLDRGVYRTSLPLSITEDFEYYVEAKTEDNESLRFPATAPDLNQTVVLYEKQETKDSVVNGAE